MLIGRDAEIATFEHVLAKRKPALVVVTGEAKMGKASLLQEFRRRAEAQNWRVISEMIDKESYLKPLAIDKDTTEQSFLEAIAEQLKADHSVSDALDQQTPRFGPNRSVGQAGGGSVTGVSISSLRTDNQADLPTVDTSQHHAGLDEPWDPPLAQQRRRRPEARERTRRPTVILINGCDPTEAFETWFINHYIGDLRHSRSPVVVVVSAYPGDVKRLSASANQDIRLGPLPVQAIDGYLHNLNDELTVKMEEDEIEEYATALSKEPAMIGALTRLLQLEQNVAFSEARSQEEQ